MPITAYSQGSFSDGPWEGTTSARGTTGTFTIDPDTVWNTWTSAATVQVTYTPTHYQPSHLDDIERSFYRTLDDWGYTAEERAQQLQREQERRERVEQERQERRERMNAAKVRGEELLRLVLLPDELDHYERCMEIVVTGSDGKRYRIDDGVVSNVHLLNDAGGRVAGLCCHPQLYGPDDAAQIPLPHRDAHASQILQLRHDAEAFWQKANIDWYDFNARTEYRRQQYGVHDPEVAHGEAHAENVRRDEIAQRRMRPDPHGWLAA